MNFLTNSKRSSWCGRSCRWRYYRNWTSIRWLLVIRIVWNNGFVNEKTHQGCKAQNWYNFWYNVLKGVKILLLIHPDCLWKIEDCSSLYWGFLDLVNVDWTKADNILMTRFFANLFLILSVFLKNMVGSALSELCL